MLNFIKCKECGNSHIGFGVTSVTVEFSRTEKTCEHCNNTHTSKNSYFFCCEKCFNAWIIKTAKNLEQ